jgi:hypothetical protein
MSVPGRMLVVDETLDRRLAGQLRLRGRAAAGAQELGLEGLTDQELLAAVAALGADPVLLTGDDRLPAARPPRMRLTLAVVDGRGDDPSAVAARRREAAHRWVHVIAHQRTGTVHRYGAVRHGPWRGP